MNTNNKYRYWYTTRKPAPFGTPHDDGWLVLVLIAGVALAWLLRNRARLAAIHLDNGRRTAGMKLRPTLASGCLCRNQMQRRRCKECRKNTGCAQWPHKAMARVSRY